MDSENRLRRVERRLEAQYAVSRVLARSATLDEAAPEILKVIGTSLGWDFAAMWLARNEPPSVRCVEVWKAPGIDAPLFERITRDTTLASGVGLPGRVLANRASAWIHDVVTDPNFPRATVAEREGLHTALAFPALAGDDVLGVVEVLS